MNNRNIIENHIKMQLHKLNSIKESKQSFNEFDDPNYERIGKTDIQVGDVVVSGYYPHRPVKIGKVTSKWAIPDSKYNSLNIWAKTMHGNTTYLKGNMDHNAAVYRKKK